MPRAVNQLTRDLIAAFGPLDLESIEHTAEAVRKLLLSRPNQELNENQLGALVSFALDQGLATLAKSTLLQRLNARDYAACLPEFLKFSHQNGKPLRSLLRRRRSEANLFCSFPNPIVPA